MTYNIGVALPAGDPDTASGNTVDDLVSLAADAHRSGLRSVWFSQRFDTDALSVAAVVGHAVPDIAIGTSVVPIYPRHPLVVANQANTAQAAAHGRFTLGLGLGAKVLLQPTFGTDATRPIRHLREYLTVLDQLFTDGTADFHGETVTAVTPRSTRVAGAARPDILVAALGPQALRVTGALADGTLPFLAGPRTLREFIVPTISEAAARAGRRPPRIVVAVAAVVTDEPTAVTARIAEAGTFYTRIPSYRAVLAREGLEGPEQLAIVGDEEHLARELERYRQAGATELVLTGTAVDGPDNRARTWAAAAALQDAAAG
ncbi:TIGR03564 family F420-dependent LLM class oxidoreductase [Millisia brevis]|uniref:TIGR03564 family F420-dependent LLM class oxidoreductase n=1 Tax=Millisia brevis TaxID=264148 RepID=UPI000832EC4B|nr:TIGR03564 family F420-dependent LLM class oxidoreductase [Millisia brevis]